MLSVEKILGYLCVDQLFVEKVADYIHKVSKYSFIFFQNKLF